MFNKQSSLILLLVILGCSRDSEIREFSVDKLPADDVAPVHASQAGTASPGGVGQKSPQRMMAAMIPRNGQAWFFKMAGAPAAVESASIAFRDLIKSVQFADDVPSWTLPDGWQQEAGSGMRFATLKTGATADALTTSVIPLPITGSDMQAYTLSNINRWRGQVGLAPLTADSLNDNIEQIKLQDDITAVLADIEGQSGGRTSGLPPFLAAQQAAQQPPQSPPVTTNTPVQPAGSPLVYTAPDGWLPSRVGGMRKAAFLITDGDKQAEVTVIDLTASAGALLPNINRWRSQVGLADFDKATMQAALQDIQIDKQTGKYIELIGAEKAILGVINVRDSGAWFFKLFGDPEIAKRESENFKQFVTSVQFK